MKKLALLLSIFCSFQNIHSQEVYFKTGKNFTNYTFKSDSESSNNLQAGSGSFYEMGYVIPLKNDKLNYAIGLILNEYNALGGDSANTYSWNTEYLGIQNSLVYYFLRRDRFDVAVNTGLGISTLLYGKQEINGTYYDLSSQKEFSGLLILPGFGVQGRYSITRSSYLGLGYQFSKSFNLSNSSDEKLSFNTHQIQFGIHFNIN
jgi:hypothetical protein